MNALPTATGMPCAGVAFEVNGTPVRSMAAPITRLTDVLRDELGYTGTKVGCEAGDCGACTVLVDGEQICACLVAVGQVEGRRIATVEGLARNARLSELQQAFLDHGAAQCGICTPGMLMAASDLLRRNASPSRDAVMDALGGVLCRCTGYQKIVEAVLSLGGSARGNLNVARVDAGRAVGARLARVDGPHKIEGTDRFGADTAPAGALWMRVVRSPHASARFSLGCLETFRDAHDGIEFVLSAGDVPGRNGFGIYPHLKDQRVFAENVVRFAGEAVIALVGTREAVWSLRAAEMPVEWHPLEAFTTVERALEPGAPLVQDAFEGNVLARGHLSSGDAQSALAGAAHVAREEFRTTFVEHAYIEPEAGYAMRTGDGVTVFATTQAPYMDRDEVAAVLGIAPEAVRIVPSACGGGFGGKLDVSVQPLLAVAAWVSGRAVRVAWTRPESMRSSTKRHPARIDACFGCDEHGQLVAARLHADFNTGAYSSWGPTVADRVPVHASGPYFIPNVTATSQAVLTNLAPSGAFRGFGVPQAALAHEAMLDKLAQKVGIDPLEMRLRNAIRMGQTTPSGQQLEASVGLVECLHAVATPYRTWRAATEMFNRNGKRKGNRNGFAEPHRRGVGLACSWYGCGNTSVSNPSTMHVGVSPGGQVTLYSGAVDIGQGANNVMVQVCADALGVAPGLI
ncbi:MAG: molybdopterin cofactor-binding domain-containing protein, partial [Gammaproteobacteria bacterium]